MKNCTCNKLDCGSDCLCACHRVGETRIHRVVSPLSKAVDICIERMQKYNLKK